jgi:hypothetical protein
MRPFHEALRRAVLIGLAAGLLGGLAAANCLFSPASACERPERDTPPEDTRR